MEQIQLPDKIEDYHERIEIVRKIASSGYLFAINYRMQGPEYFDTSFSAEWQQIYQDRNYFLTDPVFRWVLLHNGAKRWSEISFSSKSRVLQHATKFGMNYGAVFARRRGFTQSFFSVCRADREIHDEEIDTLNILFDDLLDLIQNDKALSDDEINVLKSFASGATQKEISSAYKISEGTVKNHVRSAKKKLGCKSLAQVVSTAVRKKLI